MVRKRWKYYTGTVWYTTCAQGAARQPDYGVRYKNRWYRVPWERRNEIEHMEVLDYGLPRLNDYLYRKYINFRDLPILHGENIPW